MTTRNHLGRAALRAVVAMVVLATCGGGPTDGETAASDVGGILGRRFPAAVGTPAGLFLYGGSEGVDPLGGAALVDPVTGAEAALPEPPFEVPLAAHSVAAYSGTQVFVLGELCAATVEIDDTTSGCEPGGLAAAVYSPAEQSWRSVGIPEELVAATDRERPWVSQLRGVTDDGLIVLDLILEGDRAAGQAPFWTFDPATDEWVHLDDPGVVVDDACVAGDRLVVNSSVPGENLVATDVSLSVLSLDDDAEWEQGPALDEVIWSYAPKMGCGDDFAVVYESEAQVGEDAELRAASFLTGTDPALGSDWMPLPDLGPTLPGVDVWTGQRLAIFGFGGGAVALDRTTDEWVPLADAPSVTADLDPPVVVGDLLVTLDPASPNGLDVGDATL